MSRARQKTGYQVYSYFRWLQSDLEPVMRIRSYGYFFIQWLVQKVFESRKYGETVWLIGEARGECTRDNGYQFFVHCRDIRSMRNVYFVVDRKSAFKRTVQDRRQVVIYGSREHVKCFLRATACFYTHTFSDFILRELFWLSRRPKMLIFLHHGVLGFKKFDAKYTAHRNNMDLFTVGSRLERDILVNHVGVSAKRVAVTGYARYDNMTNTANDHAIQICYMPTHRDWLTVDSGSFTESTFFLQVDRFLRLSELTNFLRSNNVIFKFRLHGAMSHYSSYFKGYPDQVQVIHDCHESPSDLIRASHMLITDYSSVAWDFFYLGKPCLFYRFDLDLYTHIRQSYVSLEKEFIGEVFRHPHSLMWGIKRSFEAGFTLSEKYKAYRSDIMPRLDSRNSDRIIGCVESAIQSIPTNPTIE